MKASIIIPCYQRPDWLQKTLESVLGQLEAGDEVIVIYQAQRSDRALEKFCQEHCVRYVFSDQPSTPRARNIGVQEASGETCIFFDDDVELLEGCLVAHKAAYQQGVVGVAGRVITYREAGPDQTLQRGQRIGYVTKLSRVCGDQQYNSLTREQGAITPLGCNMSMSRAAILKAGKFDETYIGNAMREETDLAVRLLKQGDFVFEPKAAVKHFLAKTGGSRAKPKAQWYADYFFNEGYFISKFANGWCYLGYLRMWQFILKYWLRFGRSFHTLMVPFHQIRLAQRKVSR